MELADQQADVYNGYVKSGLDGATVEEICCLFARCITEPDGKYPDAALLLALQTALARADTACGGPVPYARRVVDGIAHAYRAHPQRFGVVVAKEAPIANAV